MAHVTPRTAEGRAMLADVRASALPGSLSHDENIRYVLAIEAEAAASVRAELRDTLAAFDLYGQQCRLNEAEDIRDGDPVRYVTAARAETWERAADMLRADILPTQASDSKETT